MPEEPVESQEKSQEDAGSLLFESRQVRGGEFIELQGDPSNVMYFLSQGRVELLRVEDLPIGGAISRRMILEKGERVAFMEGPAAIGVTDFLMGAPRNYAIIAASDCELTAVHGENEDFPEGLSQRPEIAIAFARRFLRVFLKNKDSAVNGLKLLANVRRLNDNIALTYFRFLLVLRQKLEPTWFPRVRKDNPVLIRGRLGWKMLTEAGIKMPQDFSAAFVDSNWEEALGTNYMEGPPNSGDGIEDDVPEFCDRLINELGENFDAAARNDPFVSLFIIRRVHEQFSRIERQGWALKSMIEESVAALAGPNESSLETLLMLMAEVVERSGKAPLREETHQLDALLFRVIQRIESYTELFVEMYGMPCSTLSPKINEIFENNKLRSQRLKEAMEQKKEQSEIKNEGVAMDGLLGKILSTPGIDSSWEREFQEALEAFRTMEDPYATDKAARKIKQKTGEFFWNLYTKAYLHHQQSITKEPALNYFFRFGIVDETLLARGQVDFLQRAHLHKRTRFPIYYADEWLEQIAGGEEDVSRDSFGRTFEEAMAQTHKRGGRDDFSAKFKISYEISTMLAAAAKMSAGAMAYDVPVLTKDFIRGDIESQLVTKARLEEAIQKILDLDYTLFYRKVKHSVSGRAEFFYREVVPNFIILPCAGSKGTSWQEFATRNKGTRGRIVIPVLAQEDLDEILIEALARYRWEMNKTVMGYDWADPVEGELTGKYFDFITFYKKDRALSEEEKAELTAFYKKFPGTVEKFIQDYKTWLRYEMDGIQKINKILRPIFYEHIPPPKHIRERLQKMPAYVKMATVNDNRRKKQLQELSFKKKRYDGMGVDLTEMIRDHVRFYTF